MTKFQTYKGTKIKKRKERNKKCLRIDSKYKKKYIIQSFKERFGSIYFKNSAKSS